MYWVDKPAAHKTKERKVHMGAKVAKNQHCQANKGNQ